MSELKDFIDHHFIGDAARAIIGQLGDSEEWVIGQYQVLHISGITLWTTNGMHFVYEVSTKKRFNVFEKAAIWRAINRMKSEKIKLTLNE